MDVPEKLQRSTSATRGTSEEPLLDLAARHFEEIQECNDFGSFCKLEREFRDVITDIYWDSLHLVASFTRVLYVPPSDDCSVWQTCKDLAQRALEPPCRNTEPLIHKAVIIALWGRDRFQYYRWNEQSTAVIEQLHHLASIAKNWDYAVSLLNLQVLARYQDCTFLKIGYRSPVNDLDLAKAVDVAKLHQESGFTPVDEIHDDIDAVSVEEFALKFDRYGMLVPTGNDTLSVDENDGSFRPHRRLLTQSRSCHPHLTATHHATIARLHSVDFTSLAALEPNQRNHSLPSSKQSGTAGGPIVIASDLQKPPTASESGSKNPRPPIISSSKKKRSRPKYEMQVHRIASAKALRQSTLLSSIQEQHSQTLNRLLEDEFRQHGGGRAGEKFRHDWFGQKTWASIYVEPESQFGNSSATRLEADIWYLSWSRFEHLANTGCTFTKPIIIRQRFCDSGYFNVHEFVQRHFAKCDEDVSVSLHNSGTNSSYEMKAHEFAKVAAALMARQEHFAYHNSSTLPVENGAESISNAYNLPPLANGDLPLLTSLPRYQVLEGLLQCVHRMIKRQPKETQDLASSMRINQMTLEGAFSGPCINVLGGVWIRCLTGCQIWFLIPAIDKDGWDRFRREGNRWSPNGESRMFILQQDDVLFFPPGQAIIHAHITLTPALIDRGLVWDNAELLHILDVLLWAAENQDCASDSVPLQLPRIVSALEHCLEKVLDGLFTSDAQRHPDPKPREQHRSEILDRIRRLKKLGCDCWVCMEDPNCQCRAARRSCTAWCTGHPHLPPEHEYRCMFKSRPKP
ncbi:hypothetical protein K461DRAFT_291429 [Myriangium duriaei CBS 260.36]|uniref:Uncharacterized protein n=1 Tax=Myriangium duriaei CBS 260.36 TaxID=1168546 RepID=A0A9P4MIZ8_9PEZI|nr:hypothetical protein K461DRAFT_291429 [Myriangium duriaei CBS 260.36]